MKKAQQEGRQRRLLALFVTKQPSRSSGSHGTTATRHFYTGANNRRRDFASMELSELRTQVELDKESLELVPLELSIAGYVRPQFFLIRFYSLNDPTSSSIASNAFSIFLVMVWGITRAKVHVQSK